MALKNSKSPKKSEMPAESAAEKVDACEVKFHLKHSEALSDAENGNIGTAALHQGPEKSTDPWDLPDFTNTAEKWEDLTISGKLKKTSVGIFKIVSLLVLLYFFVCSLDLLSAAFRLLGGRATGEIFQRNALLQNPVVGVMIGILTTVLVQSSSTSTSIIVSMVAANFLTVRIAIPIVMGANIGTSVTNTIVSLTQMGDRNEFRRAFAAATVHDMFNWLTVITLFITEIVTRNAFGQGYLEVLSDSVTRHINFTHSEGGDVKLLNALTEPLTSRIVQIDKRVIEGWSKNDSALLNASLVKTTCRELTFTEENATYTKVPCQHLFALSSLSDITVGAILLVVSILVLCGCLVAIVKVLNSMLKGQIANVIRTVINAKVPYIPWITGYLALLIGAVMTFLVQSSSVFTSALTPLVGVGVISLERVYPLTLGSNIGTTTTSLIAALAADSENVRYTLQISLCHFFFNITGILLFFPIPFTRFPIAMAKSLGDTTARYRWFSVAYLLLSFFFLPAFVLGLSLAGSLALALVGIPILGLAVFVIIVNVLQNKRPGLLPPFLRDWSFLPLWLRSLDPLDNLIKVACNRLKFCKRENHPESCNGVDNPVFH